MIKIEFREVFLCILNSKIMRTLAVVIVLLLGISNIVSAQMEEKMEKEGVVRGSIVKDGQEIEGYIKIKGVAYSTDNVAYPAPWDFQTAIRFIPKDVFENTEKIKSNLYKKYGPKDISEYHYGNMVFEAAKYGDMSAVGPDMIPKWMFLQRLINGKISVFVHFAPTRLVSNKGAYETRAQETALYRKGKDGKVKVLDAPLIGLNMNKYWEDCPYVKEKHESGAYTGTRLEVRIMAIEDYNKNCN
jgi:hypothetical protein